MFVSFVHRSAAWLLVPLCAVAFMFGGAGVITNIAAHGQQFRRSIRSSSRLLDCAWETGHAKHAAPRRFAYDTGREIQRKARAGTPGGNEIPLVGSYGNSRL